MIFKQYIADAFTHRVFEGNPAAVCIADSQIPDALMLNIAKENNLSETAFLVKNQEGYNLRWFTPGGEIDLCGHATLASAFILLNYYEPEKEKISFSTLSGRLTVVRKENLYEMNFPAYELRPVPVTEEMAEAIGAVPTEAYMGRDLLCVFNDESIIRKLSPDSSKLKTLDGLLLQATGPSQNGEYDCVSRTFGPKLNVPEDPVCGSGHCHIVPYWAGRLSKKAITAYQASPRGGVLHCRLEGSCVILGGEAALYSQGEIYVPD